MKNALRLLSIAVLIVVFGPYLGAGLSARAKAAATSSPAAQGEVKRGVTYCTPGGVGLQDRYAAAWRHAAARFAKVEGVMGYDLMNEPFPGSLWRECSITGCREFDQRFLAPFWAKVIGAIRQSDPRTLIFYEPNVIFDFDAATYIPRLDPRLGFSFHPYVQMAKGLGMAEQHAVTTGSALFATEWGATTDVSAIRNGADLMDGAMMSWLYWAWANKTPSPNDAGRLSGIAALTGRLDRGGQLRAIARSEYNAGLGIAPSA